MRHAPHAVAACTACSGSSAAGRNYLSHFLRLRFTLCFYPAPLSLFSVLCLTSSPCSVTAEHTNGAEISAFDMPKFEDSGRGRGIARITFATAEGAAAAMAVNGTDYNGRSVSVEVAQPRAPRAAGGAGALPRGAACGCGDDCE